MAEVTFPEELGGDGNTYSDDANPETGLAAGGHRERFVPALGQALAMAIHAKERAESATADAAAAADSQSAAAGSEGKAQSWAEEAEDAEVEPGAYSAKHHAAKASASAGAAADSESAAAGSEGKAQSWAEEAEDAEVEPGAYSAKHHAAKASASAAAAADSESAAADSERAAADSEGNAAATWDAIRGVYYGPLAEDPVEDPLGNPPAAGDRYFNTTEGVEKGYNGSQWVTNEVGAHEAAADPHPQYMTEERTRDTFDTFEIFVPDPERRAVEAATSGAATIERTPSGQSCYMWIVSKGRAEDLEPGGALGTGVHEAFLVNAAEKDFYMVGMYPAALRSGEVVSQPGLAPWRSNTFDETLAACAALGAGWHQATIWEWAYIALWCMANGYQPTGNTNHGRSHANTWETAAREDSGVPGDSGGVGNNLTGYGPNAWNHNAGANGIADLVGNVWERLNLMKMVDGRIFLANDNEYDLAESAWADTGWDMPSSDQTWSSSPSAGASDKLKRALIVPNGVLDPDGRLYTNTSGERIPLRGGSRNNGGRAGLGALNLFYERGASSTFFGLRLARVI